MNVSPCAYVHVVTVYEQPAMTGTMHTLYASLVLFDVPLNANAGQTNGAPAGSAGGEGDGDGDAPMHAAS